MTRFEEKPPRRALLPTTVPALELQSEPKTSWTPRRRRFILAALILLAPVFLHRWFSYRITDIYHGDMQEELAEKALCPQEDDSAYLSYLALSLSNNVMENRVNRVLYSNAFHDRVVDHLAGAIKIPTTTFDTLGPVDQDEHWKVFTQLHEYLFKTYPRVHETLTKVTVNKYGLVYHWTGTDRSLKPLLLTAHQDVVPVNNGTLSDWIHPPFSGHYDGEWLWGRGAADDKAGLIGIFEAIETLIENGFEPRRTIVIASGFDEEISGHRGAAKIAEYLQETYGKDSFALMIDEGPGISISNGVALATPGIAEKGYVDVRVSVSSPGGHSSVPPVHTSIGYLALALTAIEAHPHEAHLTRQSPYYGTLLCLAQHAPAGRFEGGEEFRKLIKKSVVSKSAFKKVEKILFTSGQDKGFAMRNTIGTTTAVDLISGGVKVNALPEQADAVINHRISTDEHIQTVIDHYVSVLSPVARKHNLSLNAFGHNISTTHFHLDCPYPNAPHMRAASSPVAGAITISKAFGEGIDPAPVTPTTGKDAEAYRLLSRTIRRTYNTRKDHGNGKDEAPVYVAPSFMPAATDTKYYWDLTKNIFRYAHLLNSDVHGFHTVNEGIRVNGFIDMIRFFTAIVLDADVTTSV